LLVLLLALVLQQQQSPQAWSQRRRYWRLALQPVQLPLLSPQASWRRM
jgi:hypothetical protein